MKFSIDHSVHIHPSPPFKFHRLSNFTAAPVARSSDTLIVPLRCQPCPILPVFWTADDR
ncbi:uncharacterized protein LAESUDRAFT_719893 [Laetiporus sulphureus 93-53]|uniref:Uncharacterized protein n=1 Tax=Laetiporus sulphureus 93-53 TaxID=1314785 RepID=A0A165HMY7_9APHY|nr:uncharacterized protein LAESUDRAFT_719893 [Laetiporus sulphureus 93-53]KZT11947.1 hypothetical protein LAESUDRAFT_719893 [Laetiporus sulphureus 93-53]